MKTFIKCPIILLCAAMVLSLVGCGNTETVSTVTLCKEYDGCEITDEIIENLYSAYSSEKGIDFFSENISAEDVDYIKSFRIVNKSDNTALLGYKYASADYAKIGYNEPSAPNLDKVHLRINEYLFIGYSEYAKPLLDKLGIDYTSRTVEYISSGNTVVDLKDLHSFDEVQKYLVGAGYSLTECGTYYFAVKSDGSEWYLLYPKENNAGMADYSGVYDSTAPALVLYRCNDYYALGCGTGWMHLTESM